MTNWKPGALALAVAIVAVGCGGSSSSPTAPTTPSTSSSYTLVSASVTPSLLPPGETASASVWGWTRESGSPIYGPVPNARWASSNPSVASVTTTGTVTANAPGTASITSTSDAGSHSASIRVFSTADIDSLLVTCLSPVQVRNGTSCQALASTRFGTTFVRATWSSSKPEIASILGPGFGSNSVLVNANALGQTVITATYGTFTASATLEVR